MTIDFKQDILAPVANDFAAMDTFINEGITSKVALVMAVSKHVVEAGANVCVRLCAFWPPRRVVLKI